MKEKLIVKVSYQDDGVPRVKIQVGDVIRDLHDTMARIHETNISTKTALGDLSVDDARALHCIGLLLAATTKPVTASVARDAAVYADAVIASEAMAEVSLVQSDKYKGVKERCEAYAKLVKKMSKDFDEEMSHIKEWEKKK